MTIHSQSQESYSEAIEHLNEVLEVLNRPGVGLGASWGLQRGQAAWFDVLSARNRLERIRNDLERHERIAETTR
jgi:hypothetical protein